MMYFLSLFFNISMPFLNKLSDWGINTLCRLFVIAMSIVLNHFTINPLRCNFAHLI